MLLDLVWQGLVVPRASKLAWLCQESCCLSTTALTWKLSILPESSVHVRCPPKSQEPRKMLLSNDGWHLSWFTIWVLFLCVIISATSYLIEIGLVVLIIFSFTNFPLLASLTIRLLQMFLLLCFFHTLLICRVSYIISFFPLDMPFYSCIILSLRLPLSALPLLVILNLVFFFCFLCPLSLSIPLAYFMVFRTLWTYSDAHEHLVPFELLGLHFPILFSEIDALLITPNNIGEAFLLTVGASYLQLSFFAYSPLSCLLEALSPCKQKSSNCKHKAPIVRKKFPNTTVSKKAPL